MHLITPCKSAGLFAAAVSGGPPPPASAATATRASTAHAASSRAYPTLWHSLHLLPSPSWPPTDPPQRPPPPLQVMSLNSEHAAVAAASAAARPLDAYATPDNATDHPRRLHRPSLHCYAYRHSSYTQGGLSKADPLALQGLKYGDILRCARAGQSL